MDVNKQEVRDYHPSAIIITFIIVYCVYMLVEI